MPSTVKIETTLCLHQELVDVLDDLQQIPNDLSLELIKFFGSDDRLVIEYYSEYYDVDSLGVHQVAALTSRLRWILHFAKAARRHSSRESKLQCL